MNERFNTLLFLKSRPFLVTVLIALLCAFVYTSYQAINNIVAEQSQIQQQALSPVHKLVNEELLRPLHIAQTFAQTVDFQGLISADTIDEAALLDYLAMMEQRLGLAVFVALEKPRRQFMSNGKAFDLIEGQVYWYFEAIAQNKNLIADLGQVGDIHLYFDVKIFDKNDEFLGLVGVGKRIQLFLDQFDQHKDQYGFDFLFVNEKNEILLTSLPDLIVIDEYVPPLSEVSAFSMKDIDLAELDGRVIDMNGESMIVSEMVIEELDWRLLLLVPIEHRQATITQTLVANSLVTFSIVGIILGAGYFLLMQYKLRIEQSSMRDPLTELPNRSFLHRQYLKYRKESGSLCIVICDLDRFKAINDEYGHNAGDEVLKCASKVLTTQLRRKDVVGRWGGEEFVMLIPAESSDIGEMLAERARQEIAQAIIMSDEMRINVTASFGVAFGDGNSPMSKLVGMADVALYKAKKQGRNRVVVANPS